METFFKGTLVAGAERVVRERKRRMNGPRGNVLADCSRGATVADMKKLLVKGKKAK